MYPCILFFLLAGHNMHFIAPCKANKSIFLAPSREKILWNMGKTFIFLVAQYTFSHYIHKSHAHFSDFVTFVLLKV